VHQQFLRAILYAVVSLAAMLAWHWIPTVRTQTTGGSMLVARGQRITSTHNAKYLGTWHERL
jgi:hypothetical protein